MMTFGEAIEALKQGQHVQTAQGKYQPGWLASQADMLATDWSVVVTTR